MKVQNEEELCSFDNHPEKIMEAAVAQYKEIDPAFLNKFTQLQAQNGKVVQKLS